MVPGGPPAKKSKQPFKEGSSPIRMLGEEPKKLPEGPNVLRLPRIGGGKIKVVDLETTKMGYPDRSPQEIAAFDEKIRERLLAKKGKKP